MNGLSSINVELTSRCNKDCWMCGRRKIEKAGPTDWGDMPLEMVESIAGQVPPGVFVQLHNNGEPLLYPEFKKALEWFRRCAVGFDTNGKLLVEKERDIIGKVDTLTISVIQDDKEEEYRLQFSQVEQFLKNRGDRAPLVVFRILGKPPDFWTFPYYMLSKLHKRAMVCHRVLHAPDGSRDYAKPVTIPEIGVCLEMLHKLSIDRYGNVSPCVRFDPDGLGFMGTLTISSLKDIWTSQLRRDWLNLHLAGKRDEIPFCARCDYWGIPRG